MRTVTTVLVGVLIGSLAGGCQWRKAKGEWEGIVPPQVLETAELNYYWHTPPLPLEPKESVVRLYLLDENLYCLTNQNRLAAVRADVGVLKWIRRIADASQTVFRPVHADGVRLTAKVGGIAEVLSGRPPSVEPIDAVMLNTLSHLVVLNRSSGEEMRSIPLQPPASTGGATDGMSYYVGTSDGRYYALRLLEAIRTWTRSADKAIVAPMQCFEGRLYVASRDGTFRSITTGPAPLPVWTQQTYGAITAPFHVDDRGCFVGSEDNRLHAFSPGTGANLWDPPFACKVPLVDPVQVAERTVFQYARGDRFYAIDLASGRVRWENPDARRVLAVIEGKVYLLDKDNNLLIVDEVLGRTQNALPLTGMSLFASNTTAPAVYAATSDGRVCCIRPIKAGHLTAEMLTRPKK